MIAHSVRIVLATVVIVCAACSAACGRGDARRRAEAPRAKPAGGS